MKIHAIVPHIVSPILFIGRRSGNSSARFLLRNAARLIALLPLITACNPPATHATRPTLSVFAAASLGDVLDETKGAFSAADVVITSGSSGLLCKQIENGALADVIGTADRAYLTRLADKQLILTDSIKVIAENRLVLVRPRQGADLKDADLAALLSAEIKRIAIGNPDHVPAGKYAMQALVHEQLDPRLRDKLVYADDVRMAARYVATRSVDAAIIYQTDAEAFKKELMITYSIPESFHDQIEYVAAVCSSSRSKDLAGRFIDFLCDPAGTSIWTRRGFTMHGNMTTRPATP